MSEVKVCPTCGSEYPVSERFCPRDGSALKSQNPEGDLVGSVIADRYHVMRKLGEGGMGSVYLAEHVKMGRKSAIKVMNPGMSKDADAIARFHREASNASRMSHPNICAIYDFGETNEGLVYLAMEFIEGQSLTSIIESQGALPAARAASIVHQAADGLQVAHDYGIVHRDLKPDNIMIAKGRDGSDMVKLVDFGIAKASTSDAQKVTKTGLVVGTPEYMSPEQLAGDKLDGRSDIYSLALVGFNMLTGALPFPGATSQETMIARLTDEPKTLAEMNPNVVWPAELQRVMDKALARNADERYQKAADFGREFATAIERMPSAALAEAGTLVLNAQQRGGAGATAAIPRTRVASDADQKAAAKFTPASTPVATKSGKGMIVGISSVAIIAIAVAGYLITQGKNTPVTTPDSVTQNPALDSATKTGSQIANNDSKAANSSTPSRGNSSGSSKQIPPQLPPETLSRGGVAAPPSTQPVDAGVGIVITRYQKLVDDGKIDSTSALRGLSDVSAVFDKATPDERTKIYVLRTVFNYELDRFDEACRSARSAKTGIGLLKSDDAILQTLVENMQGLGKCKSAPAND